jgi:ankyrin repeat protein
MLFDAIRNGNADEVSALLAADPELHNARTPEGTTPVLWAVYTGHAALAPLLLGSRAPDFFEACALGRTGRIAVLLAADPAVINSHSADGFTGLGFACFFKHLDAAKLLLDRGADPGLPSANALRVAPLHSAVAADLVELVELLLAHGADPSPREGGGSTPLHSAAGHGNREIIARLLAAGADPSAQSKDGKTPADLARQHGHPEVVGQLGPNLNLESIS